MTSVGTSCQLNGIKETRRSRWKDAYCRSRNEVLVTEGVSPGETLNINTPDKLHTFDRQRRKESQCLLHLDDVVS